MSEPKPPDVALPSQGPTGKEKPKLQILSEDIAPSVDSPKYLAALEQEKIERARREILKGNELREDFIARLKRGPNVSSPESYLRVVASSRAEGLTQETIDEVLQGESVRSIFLDILQDELRRVRYDGILVKNFIDRWLAVGVDMRPFLNNRTIERLIEREAESLIWDYNGHVDQFASFKIDWLGVGIDLSKVLGYTEVHRFLTKKAKDLLKWWLPRDRFIAFAEGWIRNGWKPTDRKILKAIAKYKIL